MFNALNLYKRLLLWTIPLPARWIFADENKNGTMKAINFFLGGVNLQSKKQSINIILSEMTIQPVISLDTETQESLGIYDTSTGQELVCFLVQARLVYRPLY